MNFFKKIIKKNTQLSICASYNYLLDKFNFSKKEILIKIATNYKNGAPFNLLEDVDIDYVADIFSKFDYPCLYLANLISECDDRQSVDPFRDKDLFIKTFMFEIISKIEDICKNDKKIAAKQNLSVKEACIYMIENRKDWKYIDEIDDCFACSHKGVPVSIYIKNIDRDVLDVTRQIIYSEMHHNSNDIFNKIANFDNFFSYCMNQVASMHEKK